MHGDPKFSKFFVYLNLFAFSMLMLVLGENLLVTFLGWEGVGTCSYLLVSFWQTRASAATAGKKAFVTNRVGDFGFMLAMFLAFESVGSISYSVINHSAETGSITSSAATGIAALLFLGATGKSAQFPLYVWLPDAMEGPTPVSALIHAATMVTAGVFLMVRINPLLAVSADWLPTLIAWIGVITALFAATIAVAQNDIKKVLAYSTVSQLGYMFLAVGSGAYVAADLPHGHARLLQGAAVPRVGLRHPRHARRAGHAQDGPAAHAACPSRRPRSSSAGWPSPASRRSPASGRRTRSCSSRWPRARRCTPSACSPALLTAYYMTRQVILVFFGKARWEDHAEEHGAHGEFKPHESPPVMLIPLVVLAGLSIIGGISSCRRCRGCPTRARASSSPGWSRSSSSARPTSSGPGPAATPRCSCSSRRRRASSGSSSPTSSTSGAGSRPMEPVILANGWYYDRTISDFMGGPGRGGFQDTAWFDQKIIDGAVNGTAKLVRGDGRRAAQGRERLRAHLRRHHRRRRVLVLAWFVVVRGMI